MELKLVILALAFGTTSAGESIAQRFSGDRSKSSQLYGVLPESKEHMELMVKAGLVHRVPKISEAEADALPESFDSEANWPQCAKVIGDIRDQSNCGCCWAFGAASAASDRACIASNGTISAPFSAQDVCFNAQSAGCNGGMLYTPWNFIRSTGVVTGGQYLEDTATPPSDPFDGEGFCASFSLPHCHHHGDQGSDPYPAEGETGCPSVTISPRGPTKCDSSSVIDSYGDDKYSFTGTVQTFSDDAKTIMAGIMADGPVEAAFTVYADFEDYESGIYKRTSLQTLGGHAIRIVGWGTEDGTDYWKVANSWNPYWGEDGYFRIVRGDDECGIESQVTASMAGAKWGKVSELAADERVVA